MAGYDDVLFEEYIEYDDDEKENQTENQISTQSKAQRPTKEQYESIAAFYRENKEEHTEKRVMNDLWGHLAAHLNDIGPPAFSDAEWKRKWSVHKYNEKKRRLKLMADSELQLDQSLTTADRDAGHSAHSSTSTTVYEAAQCTQPNILEQLIEISTKQSLILENQNIIKDDLKTLKAHFAHDNDH